MLPLSSSMLVHASPRGRLLSAEMTERTGVGYALPLA